MGKSRKTIVETVLAAMVVLGWIIFVPKVTLAASVYLTTGSSSIAVGDTVVVNVMLDPAGKQPNVVDGTITVADGVGNIKISALGLGGSVLTLWPNAPSLDTSSSISFTGGVPGGFGKAPGVLFKIAFIAEKAGQVVFSPGTIDAYNNDASATPLSISTMPLSITIGSQNNPHPQDQWSQIISTDHQPPHNLTAVLGQDPSVFGGMKFLTILAIDDQSGIDHYEAKEGNLPAVRTGGTYILQDQTGNSPVTITAYDRAGNFSTLTIVPSHKHFNVGILIAALVLLLVAGVLLFMAFRMMKKRKRAKIDEH